MVEKVYSRRKQCRGKDQLKDENFEYFDTKMMISNIAIYSTLIQNMGCYVNRPKGNRPDGFPT